MDLPSGAPATFRKAVAHHYAPLRNASTLEDEEVLTPTAAPRSMRCWAAALGEATCPRSSVLHLLGKDPTITSHSLPSLRKR